MNEYTCIKKCMESFKYCQLIYKTWLHRFTPESNLDNEYFILTFSRKKSERMPRENNKIFTILRRSWSICSIIIHINRVGST